MYEYGCESCRDGLEAQMCGSDLWIYGYEDSEDLYEAREICRDGERVFIRSLARPWSRQMSDCYV